MRETAKAKQAFEDYFQLGPKRSLQKLLTEYEKRHQTATKPPPTLRLRTLKTWSREHGWQERIEEREREVALAALEKIKETATQTGYAVFQKRIADLNELAELLLEEINTEKKRWLPDVKGIGSSQFGTYERVDITRFNASLIEQFRKTLDDIAAEMGERVKGVKVVGEDGGPLTIKVVRGVSMDDL